MLETALVKPRIGHRGMERYVDAGRMEPLQLGLLASMLRGRARVLLWDDRVDDIDYGRPLDAVFITVETFTAMRAYEIARAFRARGVKVIMGGMHPTLIPDEAAAEADAILTGDAEGAFAGLLDDLEAGRLKPRYHGRPGAFQPGLRPDRSIYRGKGYLPVSLLQAGRGCVNSCAFCATSRFFGSRAFQRPIEEVAEEIEQDCRRLIFFVDDNFTADPEYAKSLMERLIPLKRLWVSQAAVSAADDPEMIRLMSLSGCLGLVIGFESVEQDSLDSMGKPQSAGEGRPYARQIRAFHDAGVNLWAALSLGHDGDSPDSFRRLYDFTRANAFSFAAFNILTPYPGTPLYDSLAAQGRLLYGGRWWLHPDYRFNQAVFKPLRMSPDELTEWGWRLRRDYNSLPSALSRIANFRLRPGRLLALAAYLSYLRIFRREIYAKQGLSLGKGAA